MKMSDIDSQAVGRSAGGFCLLPAFNDIEFLESVIFYIQPCKKKILFYSSLSFLERAIPGLFFLYFRLFNIVNKSSFMHSFTSIDVLMSPIQANPLKPTFANFVLFSQLLKMAKH